MTVLAAQGRNAHLPWKQVWLDRFPVLGWLCLFSALLSFKDLFLWDLIQAYDFGNSKNHWPSMLQIHSKHTPRA